MNIDLTVSYIHIQHFDSMITKTHPEFREDT